MMWYAGGAGVHWWGLLVGALLTVGFWAFILYFVVSLFRSFASRDHGHAPFDDDPERRLARRFANGEIDEEEFVRRLEVLREQKGKWTF